MIVQDEKSKCVVRFILRIILRMGGFKNRNEMLELCGIKDQKVEKYEKKKPIASQPSCRSVSARWTNLHIFANARTRTHTHTTCHTRHTNITLDYNAGRAVH